MPSIPILPNAYERIPNIDRSLIPADQMPAFLHIAALLAHLGRYEREFLIAVYLYEYSTQATHEISDFATLELSMWTTGGWQMMAARDGAMTIYHFGSAIEGVKNSLPACPVLNDVVDRQELRNAGGIFNGSFPGYTAIRNVVAHVADFSKTLEKQHSHAVKGPFKAGWFSSVDPQGITWLPGNMNGNQFAVTFDGEAFTYELSRETANKIRSLKERVYSAFGAATITEP